MSTPDVRTASPRRAALATAAAATGCLLAASLVVPGAGAAPAPLAKTRTTSSSPTPTGSATAGFEDGTTDGWTPLLRGVLAVRAASARSGSLGLQVSRINAGNRNGAQVSVPLAAISGSGDWVRASVWVRSGAKTTGSPAAAARASAPATKPEAGRLFLIDGDGVQRSAPVSLPAGTWVELVGYLPVGTATSTVTVGLRQWPKVGCAPGQKAVGQVDVDDVTLQRVAAPTTPTPTTTDATVVQPQCGITKR